MRTWTRWSVQLVLVQAVVASFEVNSEARSDALEARLLAALSTLLASQQHFFLNLALLNAAGTARSVSANLAVMHPSGIDDSF